MRQSLLMRCSLLAVLGLTTSMGIPAARAQISSVTTAELTRQADVVAVGRVSSLLPEWNETRTRIRTRVVISVSEFVKGSNAGSTLTVYVPGGEIDGVGEMYSDMPAFRKDEDVMVFAAKDKNERYHVAGGVEGKYSIKTDAATGARLVSGVAPLAQIVAQVRSAVEAGAVKH